MQLPNVEKDRKTDIERSSPNQQRVIKRTTHLWGVYLKSLQQDKQ